jgi:hypothetical protein
MQNILAKIMDIQIKFSKEFEKQIGDDVVSILKLSGFFGGRRPLFQIKTRFNILINQLNHK